MTSTDTAIVRIAASMAEIDAAQWDACANPDSARFNPFVSHAFLNALEQAGTVNRRTGWLPQHLVLEGPDGKIAGAMPCYLKGHSRANIISIGPTPTNVQGQLLSEALERGPITPVPGPRLLVRPGPDRQMSALAAAAITLAKKLGVSSFTSTFSLKANGSACRS